MSRWIWKFGDFEKYHNLLVHTRRQNYGYLEPPVWKLYRPDPAVRFRKKVITDGGKIRICAQGDYTVSLLGRQFPSGESKLWGAQEIDLPAGEYVIQIRVMETKTFPALYVSGAVGSDSSWLADDCSGEWAQAGSSVLFTSESELPSIFPFENTSVSPVCEEHAGGGTLFDFGREMFAAVTLSGFTIPSGPVQIRLGESKEEAMDPEWAVIRFVKTPQDGRVVLPPSALRYLWVQGENVQAQAVSQMLALTKRAAFSCDEQVVNDVWNVAEYTFRLNCREFFLDGIKRDGWVWSADSYQSLFVDRYLYMDQELEKRTLTALGGGLPVVQYINTIMDYSYFWLMSLRDYYRTYGDADYLRQIYPQARAVMMFCYERLGNHKFIRGQGEDWVFIDWAPMDKSGALCGEQILLAEAMDAFHEIESVVFEIAEDEAAGIGLDLDLRTRVAWREESSRLRKNIMEYFYDPKLGVFVDGYESGKKNVSRQSNILAYLYLNCSKEIRKNIYEKVVCNDNVTAITTPYFKFYENQVHCEEGNLDLLEESIRNYYGSMLALGATSLYEQYDPNQKGVEHYSMYGRPFEKSLCHAWSCSPIYLLGRYRLGVVNTGIAYDTFEVRPCMGDLQHFKGTVPLPKGEVRVEASRHEDGMHVSVTATAPGGTLVIGEKRYKLIVGATTTAVE